MAIPPETLPLISYIRNPDFLNDCAHIPWEGTPDPSGWDLIVYKTLLWCWWPTPLPNPGTRECMGSPRVFSQPSWEPRFSPGPTSNQLHLHQALETIPPGFAVGFFGEKSGGIFKPKTIGVVDWSHLKNITPRKTNMEPENEIRNHHFQVPC